MEPQAFKGRRLRAFVSDQHEAWETIAASFDATRDRIWPLVTTFIDGIPDGSRVLDLMGGNGRHLRDGQGRLEQHWTDWSRPMAPRVRTRYPGTDATVADATRLPYQDETFDAILYIAGLHGLANHKDRVATLQELRRILRPGGKALITVWSRDAPKYTAQGSPGEPFLTTIPWKRDGHEVERTYFLYTGARLRSDCESAGLTLDQLDHVAIVRPEHPDNWVAWVRRAEQG